jgi:hypothetical protein
VLTQLLYIVGLTWIGNAAKLGPENVVFWLAAVLFFTFLPESSWFRRFPTVPI